MKIRNLVHFSGRSIPDQNDLVLNEVFREETGRPKHHQSIVSKESGLGASCDEILLSLSAKLRQNEVQDYFNVSLTNETSSNSRFVRLKTCFAGLVVITLFILFLVLPLIYLLHCFNIIYKHEQVFCENNCDGNPPVFEATVVRNKSSQLSPPPPPNYKQCSLVKDVDRFDCFPERGASMEGCEARGCCWVPAKFKLDDSTPYCYFPPNFSSYKYLNVSKTAFGFVAFLQRDFTSAYSCDVGIVKMTVKYETQTRLHVKITDPLNNRYEPQYPEVALVDKASLNLTYDFQYDVTKTGFKISRKLDNVTIFDSMNINNMIFSDQFLQISARLFTNYIYGLGEHRNSFLLSTNWSKLTLFNHDGIPAFNKNLYGSHPFYLSMEESGHSHGVFLLNSNAMDIILQPTPAITYRTIGGVIDLYFFMGPTPTDVISQYTDLIGRPYMPPYWGLGFHLCRFGYKTLNETIKVMQRNIDAGIPLDTQWNDLDYMLNSNDFTYDKQNFRNLPQFVKDLHSRGMHYIPLVDPGVSASEPKDTYPPYDLGMKMDIFVKNSTGQVFVGKVWNSASTVWPDFTNPSTVDYWIEMLKSLHDQFEFDGVWIDMNEPSNFLSGSFQGCTKSELDTPPYVPSVEGGVLNYKTMCMSAKHYGGSHYDVHNLYGFIEAIVTSLAMSEIRGKRPMVISRSTFAGHGRFAGHWSGDVVSDWLDMKYSVPQLLSFSLFGIPLMGADICGFNGNTTESLCNRWTQLGAFYPFSRNHNTDDGIDQDPVAMGPQVTKSGIKSLTIRYSFLPYLYTLFWQAHVDGSTVARPLLFEFPLDKRTYDIDTQFLWGPALMIVPVLEDNVQQVQAYLPSNSLWYDLYTLEPLIGGQFSNLSAPLSTIPILVRAGFVIPRHVDGCGKTTTDCRKNRLELLATAFKESGQGILYWDDGDSLNSFEEKRYSLIEFRLDLARSQLRSTNVYWGSENPPNVGKITILSVNSTISKVVINGVEEKFTQTNHVLLIVDLDLNLKTPLLVEWHFN